MGVFHVRVLVYNLIIKQTELLVLPTHPPGASIEAYLHDVFSTGFALTILFYHRLAQNYRKWEREEMRSIRRLIFVALLYVLNENISVKKRGAELALHG